MINYTANLQKQSGKQSQKQSAKGSQNTLSRVMAVALFASTAFSLTACQSTPDDGLVQTTTFQGTPTSQKSRKDPTEIAKIRTTLAGQYIRERQLDAATRQLELAFEAHRRYAPAYDMMGVLLQQEGSASNLKKAESYFKKAISLDKNFVQAHNNYGVYLSIMKRYEEAVKQFEIAGSALGYEGRIGALENLGRTHLKLNNNQAAIKAFLRALETSPNSLVSRIELIDLLIQANRIQQAKQLFAEVQALLGKRPLSPRLMLQGAKLANASADMRSRQDYTQQLLSAYPLSDEAKLVKEWLRNPNAKWQ